MSSDATRTRTVYFFEDWCKNVFICVRAFADVRGQREAWIEGKIEQEHIWCDETELMCSFADDCNLEDFFALAATRLAPVVIERLGHLRAAVDAMPSQAEREPAHRNERALLASEEWRRVQAAALSVLEAWDPP